MPGQILGSINRLAQIADEVHPEKAPFILQRFKDLVLSDTERRNAMASQISFTKYENEVLPDFRKKINLAESTEDVINCFVQTITELCNTIFEKKIEFDYEDITLILDHEPHYRMNQRFFGLKEFTTIWNDSDLSRVIGRFAKSAMNRYKRLEKYSEKTDTKMRK